MKKVKLKLKITFLITLLVSCDSFASILNIEQDNPRIETKTITKVKSQKLAKRLTFETYSSFNPLESQISRDYEFVFFYSLGCVYCKNFAPVLKKYSDNRDINVRGFILGIPGSDFINQKYQKSDYFSNSTMAKQEVIERFFDFSNKRQGIAIPSLFIMNKKNLHAYPVSQGVLTYSELARRMDELIPKMLNNEAKNEVKVTGKNHV